LQAGRGSRRAERRKKLYRLWTAIIEEEASRAETNMQRERIRFKRILAAELLVIHAKPTTSEFGREMNIDPNDSYKPEDLLK
jgi:hypothetical protein